MRDFIFMLFEHLRSQKASFWLRRCSNSMKMKSRMGGRNW